MIAQPPFDTAELQRQDNYVVHPWEDFKNTGKNQRTIIGRSEGIYVYDSDGNRLIDGPAGMWCVNVGHGRREIAEVIAAQALEMPYFSPWSLGNAPAARLADKLRALSPGYHKGCLEVCRKYDVLYISDEVVTGFGRLGHFFASEAVFDVVPDIITAAKGLTSGYLPMGATLISDRLIEAVGGAGEGAAVFSNGFTYSGHPVCAAAALKNIEIIEGEGILEHVRKVGPYFQAKLQELRDIPMVGDVRGMGLMACVECKLEQEGEDSLSLDHEIGVRIDRHCQDLGLIVRPLINMCVMSPPLIITEEQIDDLVSILRQGIERTMDEARADGLCAA